MSSERPVAIRVANLSKCYQIYADPRDRLKQSIYPRLQRLAGLAAKQYHRDFWALRDVSFEVRRGETVGIVGKNGSGKSTLLHLIVGTHAPTSGEVEVNGRITALLELGSGFNPQFTGRENVFLNAAIWGLTRQQTAERFDEIAAFADIGDFIDQPVQTYSSGMFLRLAFAVQVCLDPDILVVDEALAVGDAYFVHRCFHRIRQMKEAGKTILFVSHDTASVNNLCDRAIWISEGRVRLDGFPEEVTARYRADLFGISVDRSGPGLETDGESKAEVGSAGEEPGIAAYLTSIANVENRAAPAALPDETRIPSPNLHMGKQRARLLGIGLYDPSTMAPVGDARAGEDIVLRASLVNADLEPGTPIIFGYSVMTPRGDEIGGLNSKMAEFTFRAPPRGAKANVRARIRLPDLFPLHYAFTVAIASEWPDGKIEVEDRYESALVFHVVNPRQVVGWMRIPTEFEVE